MEENQKKNIEAPLSDRWRVEQIYRGSNTVLVFYFGSEARGSISCYDNEEIDRWMKILQVLNEPAE